MDEYTYMSAINITNVPAEEIAAGDEYQLTVSSEPATTTFKRYKWTSSNPEVATVDEKTGLVTGISKGQGEVNYTYGMENMSIRKVGQAYAQTYKQAING